MKIENKNECNGSFYKQCRLDWVMGHPDPWPDIILVMSVRVFGDEMNIGIGRMSKVDGLP